MTVNDKGIQIIRRSHLRSRIAEKLPVLNACAAPSLCITIPTGHSTHGVMHKATQLAWLICAALWNIMLQR